jgi:hypothetical protein
MKVCPRWRTLFDDQQKDLRRRPEENTPYNSPGDALEKMKTLRMKKDDSIDEHIAKFRIMVSESKLDKSSPVIINLFCKTLAMPLQR